MEESGVGVEAAGELRLCPVTCHALAATFPTSACCAYAAEVRMVRLNERPGNTIHAAWLVRVLADSRSRYECSDCGGRMFVKARSGRCPVCFTRAQQRRREIEEIVAAEAGAVLEDGR
jgi:DNA-directed RNA polymerase subunit RPC12/RpoP